MSPYRVPTDFDRAIARDVERLVEAARPAVDAITLAVIRLNEVAKPLVAAFDRDLARLAARMTEAMREGRTR